MVKQLSVKYQEIGAGNNVIKMLTVIDDGTGNGKILTGTEAEDIFKRLTEEVYE